MKASARVSAVLRNGCTVIDELCSGPPLSIRPIGRGEPEGGAAVALVGSAAAPVGGDELALSVCVGPGASLRVEAIAATMVWPSLDRVQSRQTLTINVAAGGRLVWAGQPLLPVQGSNHVQAVTIVLAADAQLDFTEEVVLGRTGEEPGCLETSLRVERGAAVLLDHRQRFDPQMPGWGSTATMADHRHVFQHLVVGVPCPAPWSHVGPETAAAVLPLGDDAHLLLASGRKRSAVLCALTGPQR